jgi:hypothetical protein
MKPTFKSDRDEPAHFLAKQVKFIPRDERFVAVWLAGSFGKEEADCLADTDLSLLDKVGFPLLPPYDPENSVSLQYNRVSLRQLQTSARRQAAVIKLCKRLQGLWPEVAKLTG